MKDINDFNKFYEQWCITNNKPFKGIDNINKYWQQAWEDFMKTELKDEYESRKQEYKDMKLLSYYELNKRDIAEQPEPSVWEQVKSQLK